MAPIGLKLGQNAFRTIPDILFFEAENDKFVRTLSGLLPPDDSSDRRETWSKCVSDDPRHFIFRRRKFFFGELWWVGAARPGGWGPPGLVGGGRPATGGRKGAGTRLSKFSA